MTTPDPTNRPSISGTGASIRGRGIGDGPGPNVMAADTLKGDKLFTSDGEDIGKISEIMLDVRGGRIAYAVLAARQAGEGRTRDVRGILTRRLDPVST
jgi:hypothetical protein